MKISDLKHIFPWQAVITFIYIIYLVCNFQDFYKFLLSIIPAVFLIFKIYYDKSKYIFTFWRKFITKIKNPEVFWKGSCRYNITNEITFSELSKKFVDKLREKNHTVANLNPDISNKLTLSIDNYFIKVIYDENYSEIYIEITSNISYNSSIKIFNDYFLEFKTILSDLTTNENDIYNITLQFKKYNPFYSLYVKNYADMEISSFNLNYNVDDLNISVSDKIMNISSANRKSIEKASKNYLLL